MANYFAPEEDTVNALPARINPNLAAQGRNSVARQSTPNYDSVLEYLGLGQPDTIQQALDHLGLSDKPARMNPNLAAQGRRMNLPARQAPGPLSEFARQAVSLDPQPDQGYGTMAAEMALGFVPGVGQAMAARDIERARRDNDPVGMAMAASSFVPFGKLIGGLKKPMSEMISTPVGRIPETGSDARKLADMLERAGNREGYYVFRDKSGISPSEYITFKNPADDELTRQIRISNHADKYPELSSGVRTSVDPSTQTSFEQAVNWLSKEGYPTTLSKKYQNVPSWEQYYVQQQAKREANRLQSLQDAWRNEPKATRGPRPELSDLFVQENK
jgi:hypothetical protein